MFRKTAALRDTKHRPGFYVHDTKWNQPGRVRWYPIPHEPAKTVMTRDHVVATVGDDKGINEFIRKIAKQRRKKRKKKRSYPNAVIDFMRQNETSAQTREYVKEALRQR